MARRSSGKILLQVLATGMGAAVLALLPWFFGALENWEAQTWDMRVVRLAEPGPATGDIALILLDQQGLDWGQEQMGLSWPWPREIHAAIIDYCRRAHAASLTLDILFLEPSAYGVEDDALLAQALERFGATALAAFLSRAETGGRATWPEDVPRPAWTVDGLDEWLATAEPDFFATRISPPLTELALSASILGNVQQRPDRDGVFRRMRPLDFFDGIAVPTLGLAAGLAAAPEAQSQLTHQELNLDGNSIPLDSQGAAILRFRGPSGTHAAYSAAAVLQSEIRLREDPDASLKPVLDPELLRGKHVFYGFSAPGLFDLRPTPVSGVYPGVEIQATFLDNFLSQDFLRDLPRELTIALVLGLCLLTALVLAIWRSPLTGTLLGLAMLLVPVALAVTAYHLGWWMPLLVQEAGVAAAALLGLIYNYATEGRQRRFIKNAFQQYLSPQVIEQLIADPDRLRLGGERKILSIFFSDLQGFTTISEKLDPEELTALLNDYLSAMTDIIQEEGGTVDKFEGDAIIAFWNAPLDVPDHALRAVRTALRAQARLAELRPKFRERTGHDLFMRIGINTGPAVVGNMGSHNRFDYSMLGDAVNLAARLEGVNKQFGTYTMISQATKDAVGEVLAMRELGRVAVVGRAEPVTVYEPLADDFAKANAPALKSFNQGLQAYYQGDFAEAVRIFSILAHGDPVAARYLEICRDLPPQPPENWNGVWKMTSK
ncbi:adenylate cyclase [Desulfonatronum thiosulfatophilum]|uniref:Adenylate cyclase n=1 Tax=Desulfonatronum thiosulfatophilum TaxID=617002 RepID=A0A1G6BX63_9BACT|nr:adenylate/guanylate cyclase domain-containing protein [Desulfonatronum thiosulfatophilum]SDB25233.1 adenylate cyclase [Desulfonatronum thiosulfatophilum]